jgi:hypothetical protein
MLVKVPGFHILRHMHHAKNHDPIRIGSIVDAALAIGEAAQPGRDMIPRRSGEIYLGNPSDLGGYVRKELLRVVGTAFGDIATNIAQIGASQRREDEAFSTANRRGLRS